MPSEVRFIALALLVGCSPAIEPLAPVELPEVAPAPSAKPASQAPPLAVDVEAPCDRAKRWLARAEELRQKGWEQRSERLIGAAKKLCPSVSVPSKGAQPKPVSRNATLLRPASGQVVGSTGDLSRIVVARGDYRQTERLMVLDGNSGLPTHVFEPAKRVTYAAIFGDELLIIADRAVELWSLSRGQRLRRFSWTAEGYGWATLIGKRLIAVGGSRAGGTVRVFDKSNGDSSGVLSPPDTAFLAKARSIDEKTLVAASDDKLYVFDVAPLGLRETLEIGVKNARVDQVITAGDVIATSTKRGTVVLHKLGAPKPFTTIKTGEREPSIALTKDGKRLMVALDIGFKTELRTYDVQSGKAVRSRPVAADGVSLIADHVLIGTASGFRLEDTAGALRWERFMAPGEIEAIALTHGFAVTHETRRGTDSFVEIAAWYRGGIHRFEKEGYRGDVLALSPSGNKLAAVVSRKAWLWDVAGEKAQPMHTPEQARGFPDGLTFVGESMLRLVYERPAATYSTKLSTPASWQADFLPGDLDGFSGTALSPLGAVATKDDGVITLANTGRVLVPKGAGGLAFSGDGEILFAGAPKALLWFDREGRAIGRHALTCRPEYLSVDHSGDVVAFRCGHNTMRWLRLPDKLGSYTQESYMSLESARLSPDGSLILLHQRKRVDFISTKSGARVATLELIAGEPLVFAPDGRIMFWQDDPPWADDVTCRVGHRAYPFKDCRDQLMDDTLLDALIR